MVFMGYIIFIRGTYKLAHLILDTGLWLVGCAAHRLANPYPSKTGNLDLHHDVVFRHPL